MTYDKLIGLLKYYWDNEDDHIFYYALIKVVELHKPQEITLPNGEWGINCSHCDIGFTYPCPTIQAIEEKLG